MAEEPRESIRLDEEVEGEHDGTSDFFFCRIGSPVPLKRSGSGFDLAKPPARPLAVSERFGLLFLAHTEGFLVVKTVDAIGLAKDIEEIGGGNGDKKETVSLCIKEKSILDVEIGDVHSLAVSTDSSVLAAAIGREIRFFSVPSLINKKQEPIFTCSIGESGHVKYFLWRKNIENSFIVLSTCGRLCHGDLEDQLKDIMDGVQAVDWSVDGKFLAVARHDVVSILTSEFKEQLSMSLLFQTWMGDADLKLSVKVDSLKWVRGDSIVVGCVQINENDEETDYLVQVISSDGAGILEACSKPVAVSFSDLFHCIVDDIVPSGGPHLFLSYLDHWELAIAANRKNVDEHIVLLAWSTNDERKGPVVLEFEQDKFIPRIELQENGDENLLLGIDVDRVSIHEKLALKINSEVKVVSSHCILLCLSCEGKLSMFHVVRLSEPSCSFETVSKPPDDITSIEENSSVHGGLKQINADVLGISVGKEFRSPEVGGLHSSGVKELPGDPLAAKKSHEKTEQSLKPLQVPVEPYLTKGISSPFGNVMTSGSETYNLTFSGIGVSASSSIGSMISKASLTSQSSKVSSKSDEAGPVSTCADNFHITSFGFQSIGKPNISYGHTMKGSLLSSSGSIPGDSREAMGMRRHSVSQSFTTTHPTIEVSKGSSYFTSSSDILKAPSRAGYVQPIPPIHSSPALVKENSIPGKSVISNMQDVLGSRVYRSPGMQESDPKLSKQFYTVTDMAKELDTLLVYIEQEGGFRDACTVAQRSLVLSLEEGLKNLSAKYRICKSKIEEQLKEIQQLQDRRMQVSARQIYMEGLFKLASNGQYWDIWNCQKLRPEFEAKQRRISKLNHGLVNELVELERHFNVLELKKYSECGSAPRGRRALLGSSGPSRQIHSLHSLYNTVSSQLAVAEQFSGCLSKQMSLLNIDSPPAKRQSITKELLESIGLEYDSESFQSPDARKTGYTPDSSKKISFLSSSSRAIKEHTGTSTLKTCEPESLRRRRDSLDRSWTTFDPPRTTVKRMLQEEYFKAGAEKLFSSFMEVTAHPTSEEFLALQKGQEARSSSLQPSMNRFQSQLDQYVKDDQKKLSKQLSESQSNSLFKWAKDLPQVSLTVGSRFPVISDIQASNIQSRPMAFTSSLSTSVLNKVQGAGGLTDKSGSEVSCIVRKPDSSTVEVDSLAKANFGAKFDGSVPNQKFVEMSGTVFSSKNMPWTKALQSNEMLNVKSGVNGPVRPTGGSADQAVSPESSFSMMDKSYPSLLANISGNVSHAKAITSSSQSCETLSSTTSSVTALPALPLKSLLFASQSLVSVSTVPSQSLAVSSLKHAGGSSPITASSVGPTQISLPSISSVTPVEALHSYSTASLQPQISKTSALPLSLEDLTSQSPLVTSQPSSVTPQSTASQASEPAVVGSKPQQAVIKSPSGEVSTGLMPDSKSILLSTSVSMASTASHATSEVSSALSNLISAPTKVKDEGLDITITEEDEMEEEAPETNTMLNLGALGGFGPTSASSAPKANPFGGPLINGTANPTSAAFSMSTPAGELFRPASFSLPSSQPMQSSQQMNTGGLSGGFSGFGQPAQIGAGQQALGSVLGTFGQSRHLGLGAQGIGSASSSSFGGGGFSATVTSGGAFAAAAAAATGGGFSALASSGGGFAGVAGGGFAAMASKPIGFAAAGGGGGGFGASSGSGFTSGGFGSFAAKQGGGGGGFSQFGGTTTTGAGKPPAELLMQMRK